MSLELIQVEELNGKTALTQPTKVEDKVTAKNTEACYDDQGREVDCDTKEVLEQDITKSPAKVNKDDKKVEPLKLISLEEVEEEETTDDITTPVTSVTEVTGNLDPLDLTGEQDVEVEAGEEGEEVTERVGETTEEIAERRRVRSEELLQEVDKKLRKIPEEGLDKNGWVNLFNTGPLKRLKDKNPELYSYLNKVYQGSRSGKGVGEKVTKQQFLDILKRRMSSTDDEFDLARSGLMNDYIDVDQASPALQRDINRLAEASFPAATLGQKVSVKNGKPVTEEDIANGVPWTYENIVGYDIDREKGTVTTTSEGYEEGYQYDEVTGQRLYNPDAQKSTYKQSGQQMDLWFKDADGKVRKIKRLGTIDADLEEQFEVLDTEEVLAEAEVLTSTDNMIGYFDKQINKLRKDLKAEGLDEEEILDLEDKIAFIESQRTEVRRKGAEASVKAAVAEANDKEKIFTASTEDYFDVDDNGNIIYDSFSPAKAYNTALGNIVGNGARYFNAQPNRAAGITTTEQQSEDNFNRSMFRAFGFYMEGGRLYSGIEFSKWGLKDSREQIKAKNPKSLSNPSGKGIEGIDYIDLDFNISGEDLTNQERDFIEFLETNVKRTADEEGDPTGEPVWEYDNKLILENNLADKLDDANRAYNVIKNDADQLLENIKGEYGTENIYKFYKSKLKNINVFDEKLAKEGKRFLPMKAELDVEVKELNAEYEDLNTKISALGEVDIELEKEVERLNEMEDSPERRRLVQEYLQKEKERNKTAKELRKVRDKLEKKNNKYESHLSTYKNKLKRSGYEDAQKELLTPIGMWSGQEGVVSDEQVVEGDDVYLSNFNYQGNIVFNLPSGETMKVFGPDLHGYGGGDNFMGYAKMYDNTPRASAGARRAAFQANIKELGLTKDNIDYDPNLTSEQEWNRLMKYGFSPIQIMELQENRLQQEGGKLLEQAELMQVYNRLMVDKGYKLNTMNTTLIRQQALREAAKKDAGETFGTDPYRIIVDQVAGKRLETPIIAQGSEALYEEINVDAELRGMTLGEYGAWTLDRLGDNVMGALGGGLTLFLRGAQTIGTVSGFYDDADNAVIEQKIAQVGRDIKSVNEFISPKIHSEVDREFSNSFMGQVYGTFIDMVFDIAIMRGTGSVGLGTSKKAIKAALRSGKILAKTKGGMKEFMKWGLGLNPTMALRTYQQSEDFFRENPEWNQITYEKNPDGSFKLENGKKIVKTRPPSGSQKMLYSAGTAFIIGKLDKLGIDATMMKGGGKLVQGILGKVLKTAKPGDKLSKLTNQEIKRLLAQNVIKVGGGALGEVSTELLQSVFEWGAQDLFNAIQGFDGDIAGTGFVNPDWGSKEMMEEMWDIAKVAAVASAPISIGTAAYETYKTNKKYQKIKVLSELGDTQFDLTWQSYTADMMNMRRKYLADKVANPDEDYTKEDAKKELQFHEEVASIMQQIPGDLRPDLKRKAYESLTTIKDLKEEIYKKDDQGNLTSTLKIDKSLAEKKLNEIKSLEEGLTKLGEEVTEEGELTGDAKVKKDYTYDPLADMKNIVDLAAEEDVEIIVAKTRKEAEQKAEELGVDLVDSEGNVTNAAATEVDGKKVILIDESTSKLTESGRQAAKHDFFHHFLGKTLTKEGNENLVLAMGNAVDEELAKLDSDAIADSEFKKRVKLYEQDPAKVTAEEKLTLLSDALSTGDIKLKENIGTKLGDFFRRLFQSLGINITLKNGKDVINFVKDYNKSVGKGKFTKAQKKAMRKGADADVSLISQGEAIAEAEAQVEEDTKLEEDVQVEEEVKVTPTEDVVVDEDIVVEEETKIEPEDKSKKSKSEKWTPQKTEDIKVVLEQKTKDKQAKLELQKNLLEKKEGGYKSKIKDNVPAIKALTNEISNLEDINTIRTGEGDVTRAKNRIIKNNEGIITKVAKSIANNPNYFAGIAPEAATQGMGVSTYGQAKGLYIDTLKGNLGTMIANEWDPTIEPDLEKFTRNRGFVRANSLATDLGVVDTRKTEGGIGITKDLTTALDIGTDEDIEGAIDQKEEEQAYLLKDKLPNAEKVYKNLKELGKDIDADSKTYKETPKLALDQTVGMFMTDPDAVYQKGKVKGEKILDSIVDKILNNKTLNKQDLEVLTPFLEQEILDEKGKVVALVADLLQDAMPDGTTPSGKSTGVQNSLLASDLYKKGERVKTKKTGSKQGLPVQIKQKLPTAKFIDIFSKGEEMKALITQTDRILTNQAIRDTQGKPAAKIGEGRSEKMYSKSDIKAIASG